MIRQAGIVSLLLLAGACASPSDKQADRPTEAATPPAETRMHCKADPAQRFVGQPYSDTLGEEVRQATGSRTLRRIAPGQPVTMDFREDRLNVEVDAEDKVSRIYCG